MQRLRGLAMLNQSSGSEEKTRALQFPGLFYFLCALRIRTFQTLSHSGEHQKLCVSRELPSRWILLEGHCASLEKKVRSRLFRHLLETII